MKKIKLKDCDINDPFFDSFKRDYSNFVEWFERKGEDYVYVMIVDNEIKSILKLKQELYEDYSDMDFIKIGVENVLKISMFKTVEFYGDKLFRMCIKEFNNGYDKMYITFKHKPKLAKFFIDRGFTLEGTKGTDLNNLDHVLFYNS